MSRGPIGPIPDGLDQGLVDLLTQMRFTLLRVSAAIKDGTFGSGSGGGGGTSIITVPSTGGGADPTPDLTPPPTPTGFDAVAGLDFVSTTTDAPIFSVGHGYWTTVIYGAKWPLDQPTAPTFTAAQPVTEFTGQVGDFSSDPNTRWCLWAKWKTRDGVQSVSPAGGVNGLQVTTGQDIGSLLELLTGQITASQLHATLNTRINLIDGSGPGTVDARLAAETAARIAALAQEASDRSAAITSEASARAASLLSEAGARLSADANLQSQINTVVAATGGDVSSVLAAIQTETTARTTADAAEAAARQTLATQMRGAYTGTDPSQLATGLVFNERAARVTAEGVIASSVTALQATVSSANSTQDAALTAEQTARASADAAEVAARQALSVKLTGTADPSAIGLGSLTSGLIFDERSARAAQDNALAQQITLLSAGASDQFDYARIWYFDAGVEGWSGQVAGAASAAVTTTNDTGWLKMVSASGTVSNAQVASPAALAIDGAKYTQVRARIQRVGTPTWEGAAYFLRNGDAPWQAGQFVAIAAPSFDTNGISVVTWDMPAAWSAATIDRIRLDLASSTTTTDYFRVDWVAIGRPSPGASAASLLDEALARAAADSAEVSARQTLSAKITGLTDPSGTTLGTLAAGLIFDERAARVTGDSANATSISNLQATVASNFNTLSSSITTEQTVRANADTANGNAIGAVSSSVTTLQSTVNGNTAAIQTEATTRATVDGYLGAQWTVRVDVGGRVVGFGISSTSSATAGPSSDFGVVADRFYIAPPLGTAGVSNISPFIVQATPTTINGQAVPAGVYMSTAFIRNGELTSAKIGVAAITSANILSLAADKITAGSLAVGQWIQSSSFVPTTGVGFRLDGGGGFEVRSTGGTRVFNLNASGTQPVLKVGSALEILANGTITIGDGSGNTLFASGTGLNVAAIAARGANALANGDFSVGMDGWTLVESFGIAVAESGINLNTTFALVPLGAPGNGTWYTRQIGNSGNAGHYYNHAGPPVAVEAGKRYVVSAYTGAHRCIVNLFLYGYDAAGAIVAASPNGGAQSGDAANVQEASAGSVLGNFKRLFDVWTVPAGVAYVRPVVRKFNTLPGQADSYAFTARVMVEEVQGAIATPSPWSPGRGIVPINAGNASTYIADGFFGRAVTAGLLSSDNFVPGNAGWGINRSGVAEFRNIVARGDIQASSIKADALNVISTLNIAGNAITIPSSGFIPGGIAGSSSFQDVVTATVVNTHTEIVPVTVTFSALQTYTDNLKATHFRLKKTGVGVIYDNGDVAGAFNVSPNFVITDALPAGGGPGSPSITQYTVEWVATDGTVFLLARSIVVLGVKR